MKKKMISLLCVVLMITGLLTGCASGKKPDEGTNQGSTTQDQGTKENENAGVTKPEDGKPVTLRFMWWGGDTRHAATLNAIERYTELHPNVTIEGEYQGYDGYQQKLMTQIASGNEPDIIQLDYIWFPDLSQQKDIFVDLSAATAVDLSSYNQSFLEEYCSIEGKIVLPMSSLHGIPCWRRPPELMRRHREITCLLLRPRPYPEYSRVICVPRMESIGWQRTAAR